MMKFLTLLGLADVLRKIIDYMIKDKDLMFEQKLDRLTELFKAGKTSEEEYKTAREELFKTYLVTIS